MCCLPCWPVRDIVLEDGPESTIANVPWYGRFRGPTVPNATAGPIPLGAQQPAAQAPQMGIPFVNTQPAVTTPMTAYAGCGGVPYGPCAPGVPGVPGTAGCACFQPPNAAPIPGTYFMSGAHGGLEMGKTASEINADNRANAGNQMYEPQDMKPSDDDISRMYWSRELDGHWIPRSRASLDAMKNFRWFVTENGIFYAVMLPE